MIVSSLVSAIEQHGIPEKIYVDNGRAYMNKRTSEKFQSENRMKVYHLPDGSFAKFLPGYTGKDTVSKPESTELAVKRGHLLTLEQYKAALAKYILKYNTDSRSGMENKAPYEVWTRSLKEITHADPELLAQMRLEFIAELRTIMAGVRSRARPEQREEIEKTTERVESGNIGRLSGGNNAFGGCQYAANNRR